MEVASPRCGSAEDISPLQSAQTLQIIEQIAACGRNLRLTE
jgi:hypothetical protein